METTTLWLSITLFTTAAVVVHSQYITVPLGIPGRVISVQLEEGFLLYPAILDEINLSKRRCCKLEPSTEALQNEVRRYLEPQYAVVLANALKKHDDSELAEAERFFKYLRESFEQPQVVNIFKSAIDRSYNRIPVEKLAKLLFQLYQPDNWQTFNVISQVQLYLYWKFIGRGQVNNFDLLSVGTYLHEIKSDKSYHTVGENMRLEIDKAIDSLKPLYAPIFGLANALTNQTIAEAQEVLTAILQKYVKRQARVIMEKAIDQIDEQMPSEQLAYQLYMMSKFGTSLMLEVIVLGQVHLYAKFIDRGLENDAYLLHVAFYINRVQSNPAYTEMDASVRSRVEKAIQDLPSTLQRVFFMPYFCAETVKGPCQNIATKQWIHFALTNLNLYKSGGKLHLQFNFAGLNDRGNYGCMEFNAINFVLSQEGGRFSNWVLQLIGNHLIFHSYGIPLCSSYPKNLKDVSPLVAGCQFVTNDCPSEEYENISIYQRSSLR